MVDEATARVHEELAVETARDFALGLLASHARTRAEVATALERRGVDPEIRAQVVERLTGVGLLDDRAVAEAYAERASARRGPRAISEALERKGIDPGLAREVAAQQSPVAVRAAALALARRKLPSWSGLARPVVERRLAGLLARRGYPAGTVYAVVREALGELDGGCETFIGADPAELQTWAESDSD